MKKAKPRKLLAPALKKIAPRVKHQLAKAVKKAIAGRDKIPADIRAPGFGIVRGASRISPGRWKMKGGSTAIVVEPITLKFGIDMRQTWQGWKGHLDGHPHGEGLTWGLDGQRSDAAPAHEHDLTTRHKNQKGLKQ
jgi:hypothetical protein